MPFMQDPNWVPWWYIKRYRNEKTNPLIRTDLLPDPPDLNQHSFDFCLRKLIYMTLETRQTKWSPQGGGGGGGLPIAWYLFGAITSANIVMT